MQELIKALIAARDEMPIVPKGETASIYSQRTGKTHSYTYASLESIVRITTPVLAKHGLVVVQPTVCSDGQKILQTMLLHSSGEQLTSVYPIPEETDIKKAGANLTYLRRYELCCLLGIAAEDDTDGGEPHEPDSNPSKPAKQNKPSNPDGISDAQRKRLFAIAKNAGWGKDSMAQELLERFDIESTADIQKGSQYDSIVAHFEQAPEF